MGWSTMTELQKCPWCRKPDSQDVDDPETLCEAHLAEHEGLSIDAMERRERLQHEDWAWLYGG